MVWAVGNLLYFATIPGNIVVAGKLWNRRWRLMPSHFCFFAYIAFAALRSVAMCPWHLAERHGVYTEIYTYSEPFLIFLLVWAAGEITGSRKLLLPAACLAFAVLAGEIVWGKYLLAESGRMAALPWAYRFIATDRIIHLVAAAWLVLAMQRGDRVATGLFIVAIFGAILLDPGVVGTLHPARFLSCIAQLVAQWYWLREIAATPDWTDRLGPRRPAAA